MTDMFIRIINFIRSVIAVKMFEDMQVDTNVFDGLESFFTTVMDMLDKIKFLVPLSDIFRCLGIIISMRIVMFAAFIFNWIIRRIVDAIP